MGMTGQPGMGGTMRPGMMGQMQAGTGQTFAQPQVPISGDRLVATASDIPQRVALKSDRIEVP